MTASSAREFFDSLQSRLDGRTLEDSGSYRFEIEGASSWRVDLDAGRAVVSETEEGGSCVIRMKEDVFLRLLSGDQNPATAFMTGKIRVEGDMAAALKLKDLLQ
jgi:putative sterol carrier protein